MTSDDIIRFREEMAQLRQELFDLREQTHQAVELANEQLAELKAQIACFRGLSIEAEGRLARHYQRIKPFRVERLF